jgi:hypothetical protein
LDENARSDGAGRAFTFFIREAALARIRFSWLGDDDGEGLGSIGESGG